MNVVGTLRATTIVCSDVPTCFAVYRGEDVHVCHCSRVCLGNAVDSGIVCVTVILSEACLWDYVLPRVCASCNVVSL